MVNGLIEPFFAERPQLLVNFGLILSHFQQRQTKSFGFGAKIAILVLGLALAGFSFGLAKAAEPVYFSQETSQNMTLLAAVLNPDPNLGRGGADLSVEGDALLPLVGPAGSLIDFIETRPSPDQISIYVVRAGDTLSSIAKMFGVSVNTIRWANNISSSGLIRIGQTLIILPINGIKYTVAKGDTIASIAKKFKADAGEIANYNIIAEDARLALGTEIIIPDGVITSTVPPSAGSRLSSGSGPNIVGYFINPLPGSRKTQGIHGRNGVDLAAPFGTPILASAGGQVIVARGSGWNVGFGIYSVIAHPNNTQTVYAHQSRLAVAPGDQVIQGQIIGYVGSSGNSTGPHLHFEVRGARNPF